MNLSFILQSIAEAKGDRYYGLMETWGSREGQYLEKCVEWPLTLRALKRGFLC